MDITLTSPTTLSGTFNLSGITKNVDAEVVISHMPCHFCDLPTIIAPEGFNVSVLQVGNNNDSTNASQFVLLVQSVDKHVNSNATHTFHWTRIGYSGKITYLQETALGSAPISIEPQKGYNIRAGIISPGLTIGGADQWILDMLKHVNLNWQGIGVLRPPVIHPSQREQAEKYCAIYEKEEGIRELVKRCDICFGWGIENSTRFFKGSSCKYILVSHGTTNSQYTIDTLKDAAEADILCAVSDTAVKAFPSDQQHRVQVLRLGTDPLRCARTKSKSQMLAQWELPADAKIVGYLGRFNANKYQVSIVEALAKLPKNWYGVAVGIGKSAYLQDRARILGVSDRLKVLTSSQEIGNVLGAFDWNLFCSDAESWGLVFVESWMVGTPVIGTEVGAGALHPEFIFPVPKRSSGKQIVDVILQNTDKKSTFQKVAAAQEYALGKYGLETCAINWHEFVKSAVKPIRIGILMPVAMRGGAERSSLMFAQYVQNDVIDYVGAAVVGRYDEPIVNEFNKYGKVYFNEAGAKQLASKCDVLMSWGISNPKRFTQGTSCKIIQTSRGNDNGFTAMAMRGCDKADAIAAVSPSAVFGVPAPLRHKVVVIPNTVPQERLHSALNKSQARRAFSIPSGKIILGFVGRMDANKNPYLLIDALKYLPDCFVVALAGRETDVKIYDYARKALGRNYKKRAFHLGAIDNVSDIYKAMDALVVLSKYEGFCNVIAEAWACRVPVIGCRVGMTVGHPELIRVVGFKDSPKKLAEIILSDFTDFRSKKERVRMAKKYVDHELTTSTFANNWRNLILTCQAQK